MPEWATTAFASTRNAVTGLARGLARVVAWAALYGTVLAAGVYGAITLASSEGFPSPDYWAWAAGLLVVLQIFVGVVAPLNALRLERKAKRVETLRKTYEACHILLLQMSLACRSLDIAHLSTYVWRPSGPPWRRRLASVAKARVGPRKSSGVTWRRGTGVIGRCWAQNLDVFADLETLNQAAEAGVDAFNAAPDHWGMDLHEVLRTQRFGTVLASPLRNNRDGTTFIGCVAIDSTEKDSYACLREAIDAAEILATIGTIENLVNLL